MPADRLDLSDRTGLRRVDAKGKVTGATIYASDVGAKDDLHAVPILAWDGPGRLVSIDTDEASRTPGFYAMFTSVDVRDGVGPGTFLYDGGHFHSSFSPLASDEIRFSGQLVGLVAATTPEAARAAAALIRLRVERRSAQTMTRTVSTNDIDTYPREGLDPFHPQEPGHTTVEAHYQTAEQFHQALEPYSMRAAWNGTRLSVHNGSQWVVGEAMGLAEALDIPVDDVRVVGPAVGGAFGSRVLLLWHVVYVAAAARQLKRPLRLHVDRPVMATLGSYRPRSMHDVSLSLDVHGRIARHSHHVRTQTSISDVVPLRGLEYATQIYEIGETNYRESVVRCDVPTPGFMRAPGEYPVAFALESALDELAAQSGTDPVELRMNNLAPTDESSGGGPVHLKECILRGAELFEWAARDVRHGAMTDPSTGETLGWGMAVAHYPTYGGGLTRCRLSLSPDGDIRVDLAAHDTGTGLASAVALEVARILGAPVSSVQVGLGDSALPLAPMAAGSSSTRTAVAAAADAARKAVSLRRHHPELQTFEVAGEHVPDGMDARQLAIAVSGRFAQTGAKARTEGGTQLRMSVGAHFVEVGVNAMAGRVRVRRMVGVFDVGRVLHPSAVISQLEGGMIWGAGHALMEDALMNPATGRFLGTGLADYHMMVHADVPLTTVEVLDKPDPLSASGAKGAGEIGVVGSSAAVMNALHAATGVRVRRLPLRPTELFAADVQ